MAIHDGHRDRVRERFLKEGLETFNDHQVLELLLFYSIARQDTNDIAHALIQRFGGLHQVFEAPHQALLQVKGVGDASATLLRLIPAVAKRYETSKETKRVTLDTTEKYGNYMVPHFIGKGNETVYLLCLNAKCEPISCRQMGEGDVISATIKARDVVQEALNMKATAVVLAHNHPSGYAVPSREDIITTRRIAMALDAVGVPLVDHIIVSGKEFVSLAVSNFYKPDECRLPL